MLDTVEQKKIKKKSKRGQNGKIKIKIDNKLTTLKWKWEELWILKVWPELNQRLIKKLETHLLKVLLKKKMKVNLKMTIKMLLKINFKIIKESRLKMPKIKMFTNLIYNKIQLIKKDNKSIINKRIKIRIFKILKIIEESINLNKTHFRINKRIIKIQFKLNIMWLLNLSSQK